MAQLRSIDVQLKRLLSGAVDDEESERNLRH
jgi:hypothetical protein